MENHQPNCYVLLLVLMNGAISKKNH